MIKVGQIYNLGKGIEYICVITYNDNDNYFGVIYSDGFSEFKDKNCFSPDDIIAEYSTWQEAVNSKEFKGVK